MASGRGSFPSATFSFPKNLKPSCPCNANTPGNGSSTPYGLQNQARGRGPYPTDQDIASPISPSRFQEFSICPCSAIGGALLNPRMVRICRLVSSSGKARGYKPACLLAASIQLL